ncbi:unnamed protein product [Didymodactylos carnosus]|uniref:Endonuclease/exonuclease/phosphatase domain-containing protein n=1 Tax=Didymodactylos carnosus TaxID=1234261 RepID=A0A8S2ENA9_9BILA|nr:unnamed protein product [Didymodactylos carnosus]CAF4074747.1 unnamed protein product [Didymodactylos carnosus]
MSVFRLATLNVHSFIDSQATSNIERLAQLLKPLALDVLAVQEACHTPDNRRNRAQTAFVETRYHSQVLSELLQLSYKVFGDNVRNFGNGILSRYPITNASNYQIEPQASEAVRGMLTVEVDNEFCKDNKATIHVTHFLDHISEHRRLSQLHLFDKHVLTTAQNSRHLQLLLGDFNSLTFEDYSQNYFDQKIRQVRDPMI